MTSFLLIFGAAAGASLVGSMVGLGGGILLVPFLTLYMDLPVQQAVAASLVAVVANSTMASAGYARDEISNVRLGMVLEVATTLGAVGGALAAAWLDRRALLALFSVFLAANAAYVLGRQAAHEDAPPDEEPGALGGRYHDPRLGREVSYRTGNLAAGLGISAVAGAVSGLLGIGGGPIKVPMMTALMGVPMKAASATSNFMIGVTACASAALYYRRGAVSPAIAAPAALGAALGAFIGARLAPRAKGSQLASLLALILAALAARMALAAWRGS